MIFDVSFEFDSEIDEAFIKAGLFNGPTSSQVNNLKSALSSNSIKPRVQCVRMYVICQPKVGQRIQGVSNVQCSNFDRIIGQVERKR